MTRCCICGKEIKDEVLEGNNPDPLKDENGKVKLIAIRR